MKSPMAEWTLREAREHVQESLGKGVVCPCCNRWAKVYRHRTITSSMAYGLLHLVKHSIGKELRPWVHIQNEFSKRGLNAARGGDFTKLRFWNLIEPEIGGVREDGSPRCGIWRVTEAGIDFGLGRTRVQRFVAIYANHRVPEWETDTTTISIRDALGAKFSYDQIMEK